MKSQLEHLKRENILTRKIKNKITKETMFSVIYKTKKYSGNLLIFDINL